MLLHTTPFSKFILINSAVVKLIVIFFFNVKFQEHLNGQLQIADHDTGVDADESGSGGGIDDDDDGDVIKIDTSIIVSYNDAVADNC